MSVRPFPKWMDPPSDEDDLELRSCRVADCRNRPAYVVEDAGYTDTLCGQHLTPFLAEVLGTMGQSVCVAMLWRNRLA